MTIPGRPLHCPHCTAPPPRGPRGTGHTHTHTHTHARTHTHTHAHTHTHTHTHTCTHTHTHTYVHLHVSRGRTRVNARDPRPVEKGKKESGRHEKRVMKHVSWQLWARIERADVARCKEAWGGGGGGANFTRTVWAQPRDLCALHIQPPSTGDLREWVEDEKVYIRLIWVYYTGAIL